jgi:hypothetical protein
MTEEIPYTHRFVANSGTAGTIARAFQFYAHRLKGRWVCYALILLLFTLLLMSGVSSRSVGAQFFRAIAFALVPTAILAVWTTAIGYLRMVRGSRLRLFNGAVLESGFGEEEMVLRNPIASVRLAYKGIKSITAQGNFVFMQQRGVPLLTVYPRDLFPDEAIDRILRARR